MHGRVRFGGGGGARFVASVSHVASTPLSISFYLPNTPLTRFTAYPQHASCDAVFTGEGSNRPGRRTDEYGSAVAAVRWSWPTHRASPRGPSYLHYSTACSDHYSPRDASRER